MQARIRLSRETVKGLRERLNRAYTIGDVRLVRRISALLGYLQDGIALGDLAQRWGFSPACFYHWLHSFVTERMESLVYRHGGGRPSRLTASQKRSLCDWLDAGPQAAGFEGGCWTAQLVQELIRQRFGVLYNRYYVCELLGNLGYSYQKARFVSDHLDEARRQAWREQEWPHMLHLARQCQALIVFGDEASFPQWGTLSYSWSRRGQQPTVPTSGKRKGYKTFGLIEYSSGRLFCQAIEGRFDSASYQAFLLWVLTQTTEHLFLIQDGARYHTSRSTRDFFAAHADRLTVFQLPSYSPDYNPIEYLWRKVKRQATHNRYFAQFEHLMHSVDDALAHFVQHPEQVLALFGAYCHEAGFADQPLAA